MKTKTYYIITTISLISILIGLIIGWSIGYNTGFQDCWENMESDLIRHRATEFERWIVGHKEGK